MQADAVLPPNLRRNYTGVFNALSSIIKADGISGLFRGSRPTVIRAMALNVGQLAGNSEALVRLQTALGTDTAGKRQAATFGAAFVAAFLASFMSLPFDFVKTRLQKQVPDPVTGVGKYKGGLSETRKEARRELEWGSWRLIRVVEVSDWGTIAGRIGTDRNRIRLQESSTASARSRQKKASCEWSCSIAPQLSSH